MYKLRLYPHHLNQVMLAKASEKRKRTDIHVSVLNFFVENYGHIFFIKHLSFNPVKILRKTRATKTLRE